VACAVVLWGCGEAGGASDAHTLIVEVTAPSGEPLSFTATVSKSVGESRTIACGFEGAAESGLLSCTKSGFTAPGVPAGADVTIRAMGYHTTTYAPELHAPPGSEEWDTVQVQLTPLDSFEHSEDFHTGFEADGLDKFEAATKEMSTEAGPARVGKFYVSDLYGEPRVQFQNVNIHPLHYDFASAFGGFDGSAWEFSVETYYSVERNSLAGTVMYYPTATVQSAVLGAPIEKPVAVTFFPSDVLTPEHALLGLRLVEERLQFAGIQGGDRRVAYLPAGDVQEEQLRQLEHKFSGQGALWMTWRELYGELEVQLLNKGEAYGTLRVLTPEELETTVVSYSDILVLTRLPNALPLVGGTITEELQTPLAHVNVAATNRGTPNMALPGAAEDKRVAPFVGKLVRFEVRGDGFVLAETTSDKAEQFWEDRKPDPQTPQFNLDPTGLPGFEKLSFLSSAWVGAKAANLSELSWLLGDNAPYGFAVPFHYYDQFMSTARITPSGCAFAMADCVSEGRPFDPCDRAFALCSTAGDQQQVMWDYAAQLLKDQGFAVDSQLREAALDGLRHCIRNAEVDEDFAVLLDTRVAEVFGAAPVRLRSSTNAEDLADFTGAGLYTSVSAVAGGPKAASRRIRRVWASTWNWTAFEERSFWNIDHLAVHMGVAVHQTFPDEQANGVLITRNLAGSTVGGMYVNVQLGEVPVTNPYGGVIPEIFSIVPGPGGGVQVSRQRFSSLSPGVPLMTAAEIDELHGMADDVQEVFAPYYDKSPHNITYDLEFKVHGPDRKLFIKQARPYPMN